MFHFFDLWSFGQCSFFSLSLQNARSVGVCRFEKLLEAVGRSGEEASMLLRQTALALNPKP